MPTGRKMKHTDKLKAVFAKRVFLKPYQKALIPERSMVVEMIFKFISLSKCRYP